MHRVTIEREEGQMKVMHRVTIEREEGRMKVMHRATIEREEGRQSYRLHCTPSNPQVTVQIKVILLRSCT